MTGPSTTAADAIALTHFEVYEAQKSGRIIRVRCDCTIGRDHDYAEARAIDVYRTLRGPLAP